MNWHEYPILKLLVPLILGILFYYLFPNLAPHWPIEIAGLFVLGFLAWPKKYLFPYKHRHISGLLIYLVFFLLGIALMQYHFTFIQEDHISKNKADFKCLKVRIIEVPEQKPNSVKLVTKAQLSGDNKKAAPLSGKIILYLQKDSNALALNYGDLLILKNSLKAVNTPANPDEFDYRTYLLRKGISFQGYLKSGDWHLAKRASLLSIQLWALKIRHLLLNQLQKHGLKDAEFSVAAAMILGVRNHLSPELRQAFSGAGAMHILCVSGLHVGIIFLLLNSLLSFLSKTEKGPKIKAGIIIGSIWLYALITGLSPSVVRAAMMFTFISIGQNIGRHVNIYNSLAASAFVLLAVNPYLLFDVGFQLSYAAVIAIVALQKPLQDLWSPENTLLFKIWQLITVSLAAQIGTAPLALYYFHSFPNYFLLTNIIVIPAAFIIFITGVFTLIFSWASPLADFLGWGLSKLILGLNWIISSIEQLPFAVSSNIYLSPAGLVALLLMIVFISIMLIRKKPKLLYVNLSLAILFVAADIYSRQTPPELIVYHGGKNDYIAFMSNGRERAISNADVIQFPKIMDYQSLNHRIRNHIRERRFFKLNGNSPFVRDNFFISHNLSAFYNLRIAVIAPGSEPENTDGRIDIDYLILCQNPKTGIRELQKHYRFKTLIISASNAPWSRKKWIDELNSSNRNYYDINNEGAFVAKLLPQ
jgi:competence protein ComEC